MSNNLTHSRKILAAIVIATCAATVAQFGRWEQEVQNHHVELVLDLPAASDYARSEGRTLESVLQEYKASGVLSVVAHELKWDDLESKGVATLMTGMQLNLLRPDLKVDASKSYVYFLKDEAIWSAVVLKQLELGLGRKLVRAKPGVVEVDLPLKYLQGLGLGFPFDQLETVQKQGFKVWLRPENKPALDDKGVIEQFKIASKAPGWQGVIFGGISNEAVGYPSCLNTTADVLREHNPKLKLGVIELDRKAQQKGMEGLVGLVPEQTVRVFAVPPAQQAQLPPERLAQMYGLAARERNARVLYLRPYPHDDSPEKGFEQANPKFLQLLNEDLGKRWGPADLFESKLKIHPVLAAVIAFVSALLTFVVLAEIGLLLPAPAIAVGCLGLSALTLAFGFVGSGQTWRTLIALGTASIFSLHAIIGSFDEIEEASQQKTMSGVYWGSIKAWLKMSAISLAGAWCASSLLQETTFKLGIHTFRGVKFLTVVVPVLVVAAWFARKGNWKPLAQALNLPIRLYHLVGFGALAVLGLVYTMRTGNAGAEMAGDALEYERYLRMVLDQGLGVRPRFKEFLMAHPAMLLAPVALRFGGPYVAWLFLLIGATGQVGLGDTFAHLHTPLEKSLIRCLLGALFGYGFGSLAFLSVNWCRNQIQRLRRRQPVPESVELKESSLDSQEQALSQQD